MTKLTGSTTVPVERIVEPTRADHGRVAQRLCKGALYGLYAHAAKEKRERVMKALPKSNGKNNGEGPMAGNGARPKTGLIRFQSLTC